MDRSRIDVNLRIDAEIYDICASFFIYKKALTQLQTKGEFENRFEFEGKYQDDTIAAGDNPWASNVVKQHGNSVFGDAEVTGCIDNPKILNQIHRM
jgi:hypothetical protein